MFSKSTVGVCTEFHPLFCSEFHSFLVQRLELGGEEVPWPLRGSSGLPSALAFALGADEGIVHHLDGLVPQMATQPPAGGVVMK